MGQKLDMSKILNSVVCYDSSGYLEKKDKYLGYDIRDMVQAQDQFEKDNSSESPNKDLRFKLKDDLEGSEYLLTYRYLNAERADGGERQDLHILYRDGLPILSTVDFASWEVGCEQPKRVIKKTYLLVKDMLAEDIFNKIT